MNHTAPDLPHQLPASSLPPVALPLFGHKVPAGFPSPADDYIEGRLSLDQHLVPHKDSTFFVRAKGGSMEGAGISEGDILVVDKSLSPLSGDVVLAVVDGEFTVKYLLRRADAIVLKPANPLFRDIEFKEGQELQIWGVVTAMIKKFR